MAEGTGCISVRSSLCGASTLRNGTGAVYAPLDGKASLVRLCADFFNRFGRRFNVLNTQQAKSADSEVTVDKCSSIKPVTT